MATNFRIKVHQNSENLHVRLDGDFDGSSAYELLDILKKRCPFTSRAFIHTNSIKHMYPFGTSVFRSHLDELKPCKHIVLEFTGEHAQELIPEGSDINVHCK